MGVRKRWWHDVQSQTRLIMRNVFLLSFSLIVFASCNSKRTLVDDLNESIVADAMPAIADTNAFNKQIRSLVYLLDPKEVSSVACYAMLVINLNSAQCPAISKLAQKKTRTPPAKYLSKSCKKWRFFFDLVRKINGARGFVKYFYF